MPAPSRPVAGRCSPRVFTTGPGGWNAITGPWITRSIRARWCGASARNPCSVSATSTAFSPRRLILAFGAREAGTRPDLLRCAVGGVGRTPHRLAEQFPFVLVHRFQNICGPRHALVSNDDGYLAAGVSKLDSALPCLASTTPHGAGPQPQRCRQFADARGAAACLRCRSAHALRDGRHAHRVPFAMMDQGVEKAEAGIPLCLFGWPGRPDGNHAARPPQQLAVQGQEGVSPDPRKGAVHRRNPVRRGGAGLQCTGIANYPVRFSGDAVPIRIR